MKTLSNHLIGVDQGDVAMFADFENGGPMWTGSGPRESRKRIAFSSAFRAPPAVHVSVSLWDVASSSALRAEVVAENVTEDRFDAVYRSWLDSRTARIRIAWMAIGELPHEDDWKLY